MMNPFLGQFFYSRFDKNQKLLQQVNVKLTSTRMVHDFAITENYAIVPDLPFEIKAMDALVFGEPFFQLDVTKPCRYGLLPRKATSQREVIWFNLEKADGHFAFHYANAYETIEDDQEIVVLYAAALKKFDCFFHIQEEHPFYKTKDEL